VEIHIKTILIFFYIFAGLSYIFILPI